MTLSQAKTSVKNIIDGFDFLGFNIKRWPQDGFNPNEVFINFGTHYNIVYEKSLLLITPSEKSINKFKDSVKSVFDKYKGNKAGLMIKELNPIIRGWAQSKMYWHCNRTFHKLDDYIFNLQVRWIKRMHPNKNWGWVKNKYFYHKQEGIINNRWVFHASIINNKHKTIALDMLQLKWFPHTDWTMLSHNKNILNVNDNMYFEKLEEIRTSKKPISVINQFDKRLALNQKQICPVCNDSLWNGEKLHKHHIIPRKSGGKDTFSNLIILHLTCHHRIHYGTDQQIWVSKLQRIKRSSA